MDRTQEPAQPPEADNPNVSRRRNAGRPAPNPKVFPAQIVSDPFLSGGLAEGRLRAVEAVTNIIVWEADVATLRTTYVSPGAEAVLGYSPDEWLQTPNFHAAHLHPDDRKRALTCERDAIETGNARTFEFRTQDADGGYRWFRQSLETLDPRGGESSRLRGVMVEITRDKEQCDARRESEERFHTTFENAGIGIALVDLSGYPFKSNLTFREMLGYSEEELHQIPFTEFTHHDDRSRDWALSRDLVEGKINRFEIEKRYIKRDGRVVWGHLTASVVKGIEGQPQYVIAMVKDITDHHRAEEALRQSEQFNWEIIQGAREGVTVYDTDFRYQAWNPFMEELTGVRAPEVLGRRPWEIFPHLRTHGIEQFLQRALAGETFESPDLKYEPGDIAKTVWTSATFSPHCDPAHKIIGVIGLVRDISARKVAEERVEASEERFRKAFMTGADAFCITRLNDGKIIEINDRFTDVLGHTREEAVGKTPVQLGIYVDPADRKKLAAEVKAHGCLRNREILTRKKSGESITVSVSANLLEEKNGEPNLLNLIRDMTESKRAQDELQHSFEQLQALGARLLKIREEERTRVAREIHDQLGQTLTAIKLDLKSLFRETSASHGLLPERASEIFDLVDESIDTVRRIATELRPGILDELGLVAALEWAAEEFAARSGTRCRLDFPRDNFTVEAERATALFRIFQETLTNVARHAEATEVVVRVARQAGHLIMEVRDNGKGIPAHKLSQGKSLGLLGMRERAKLVGGEVEISGQRGSGTTVTVRIPEFKPRFKEAEL